MVDVQNIIIIRFCYYLDMKTIDICSQYSKQIFNQNDNINLYIVSTSISNSKSVFIQYYYDTFFLN